MIAFIDIEASSLYRESYPVEVGWCFEEGNGESYLIRPLKTWTDWHYRAEELHGISRQQLDVEGFTVQDVGRRVSDMLTACDEVYCDSVALDGGWLSKLLVAAHLTQQQKLRDVIQLYRRAFLPLIARLPLPKDPGYKEAREKLSLLAREMVEDVQSLECTRDRVRHRSLQDAQGLLWTWLEICRRVEILLAE